jgi:cysteine desulfurase / selenocysteine lyase
MMRAHAIKKYIPALCAHPKLVYLDSAATALTPQVLLDAGLDYYRDIHAPVHRSTCPRAEWATETYEQARATVARLLHAHTDEVVFTTGTTSGIHMALQALIMHQLEQGDHILLNPLEHHSNLLPWLNMVQERGLTVNFAVLDGYGYIDCAKTLQLIGQKTKLIAWTLASHVLGVYEDTFWQNLIQRARRVGAIVVGDASQYVSHRELMEFHMSCDVLVVSAHKMMGPTGIGAVRILRKHHTVIKPWVLGGGMVESVDISGSHTWLNMPQILEAGTPPTAQAYEWARVIQWQHEQYSLQDLACHESRLIAHAVDGLLKIPGIRLIMPPIAPGKSPEYSHLVSFYHETLHAHDIAHMLGQRDICVRAGSLCAQPAMQRLGASAVVRISVHAYSTVDDIDTFLRALAEIVQ